MTPLLRFQLLLLGSAVGLAVLHVAVSRVVIFLKIKLSSQIVAFLSFFAGYPVVGLLVWRVYLMDLEGPELWPAIVYAVLVYSGFGYSYFHFFNMSETARRIRILTDLFPARSLAIEEVRNRFAPASQIHTRLERLLALGQIKKEGDRYRLRSRIFWSAALMVTKFKTFLKL